MNKVQQIQAQITEMIKSDYPNPIFTWKSPDIVKFQFDKSSFHGECMIEWNEEDGYSMTAYLFDIECETIEEFMEQFKEIYEIELEQFEIFSDQL